MLMALEEAAKGGGEGNPAVGSVIVWKREVISRGRNLVITSLDPTAHAEIVALREAGTRLRRADFAEHTLYTTVEPCPMCLGAILESQISTLVIGASLLQVGSRWGAYTTETLLEMVGRSNRMEIVRGILAEECARLLKG
jgi:tRNA(adenine34) deaminase